MNFKLDLFTPNGVIVKDLPCTDIKIPTVRGEINILPEHTHILTTLSTGILSAKNTEGNARHFSVTHGTCKVLGDKISILSMTSEKAEDIDPERAKEALEKAKQKLAGADNLTDVDLIKQQRKVERAEMRLKLAYLRGE